MNDTTRDALLPCPFCGGKPEQFCIDDEGDENYGGHGIQCTKCGASTNLRFACGDDPVPLQVEAWNRRAALSAQPAASAQGEASELIAAYAELESEADKDFGNDADECYAMGKRDGFQDAVQLYDLATGGDGEFKGSTIPGETVDVSAMIERTVERFAIPAPAAPTQPKVSREALVKALNDNHSPDVSFADMAEAALRALGIDITE